MALQGIFAGLGAASSIANLFGHHGPDYSGVKPYTDAIGEDAGDERQLANPYLQDQPGAVAASNAASNRAVNALDQNPATNQNIANLMSRLAARAGTSWTSAMNNLNASMGQRGLNGGSLDQGAKTQLALGEAGQVANAGDAAATQLANEYTGNLDKAAQIQSGRAATDTSSGGNLLHSSAGLDDTLAGIYTGQANQANAADNQAGALAGASTDALGKLNWNKILQGGSQAWGSA